ncbi:MAG: ABC transporter permease subunit [Jatrophihabitans sp.]|uniref:ABC transporter permease subunit n=1 Tax=Jatrophihabitans sp. TaxID=1932789 RepID=UPI003F81CF67
MAAVVTTRPAGRRRVLRFRPVVLTLAALYFFVPLLAALWFALYNSRQGFRWHALTGMFGEPSFAAAFLLSVRLSVATVLVTLVLMVPTTLLIHLKLPRMRRAVEIACILPLVIPPVVLVVGVFTVLGWGPRQLAGTPFQSILDWMQNSSFPVLGSLPVILVVTYVVMALPFTYRTLDAGLRTSNMGPLAEAARGLGASWPTFMVRVAVPALRTSILNAAFLAFALAFGEFTVASILNYLTFAPWIYQYNNTDGQLAVGVSLLSLVITWVFLLVITALGRTKSTEGATS